MCYFAMSVITEFSVLISVSRLIVMLVILCFSLCLVRILFLIFFFFFSSRRRHTRFDCDWSSDVCSSDLVCRLLLEKKKTLLRSKHKTTYEIGRKQQLRRLNFI